jgi:hypothetical protein
MTFDPTALHMTEATRVALAFLICVAVLLCLMSLNKK